MNDNNGVWYFDKLQTVDIIADFIQNWLEDNISEDLYNAGKETSEKYSNKNIFDINVVKLISSYCDSRLESFEKLININELEEVE